MNPTIMEVIGASLFALALIHTFSTKLFEHLAHTRPQHAGFWHLLGEIEVVFGFWALVLIVLMMAMQSTQAATAYLDSRNFTEPMFVFVVMVIAGSKAILHLTMTSVRAVARLLPLSGGMPFYFTALALVPLLGSFITEPAAMTLAALMLRDRFFAHGLSTRLKYVTVGVLFVNISIGGTLTPFAAPPVLMVAGPWGWDIAYMLTHFGWKMALAVVINAWAATLLFRAELQSFPGENADGEKTTSEAGVPASVVMVHLLFLTAVVVFAHHPPVFMGLFLFFLGFATAYPRYQNPLILREGLMVAFFLAGLVVLGGQQQWWLQPLLMEMDANQVYFGSMALTAITDNAALTYLGSLVEGLPEAFKQALVAGAVTGGGLTVIANAPNPAGYSILKGNFADQTIHPLGLLAAALPPTLVAVVVYRLFS